MKITFLGTSAGESYPAIWCECPNCTYAREHGGKNLRMNTGTMLDQDVLLDLNSCTFYTAARLGISFKPVKTLLVTHPHGDHNTIEPYEWRRGILPEAVGLSFEERQERGLGGPAQMDLPMLNIYGNSLSKEKIVGGHPDYFDGSKNYQVAFHEIEFGKRYSADHLEFIPVKAFHGPVDGFANSFIIERDGKRLLYALDTGGFAEEDQAIIDAYSYDAVIMEGTFGLSKVKGVFGHQNMWKNIAFRDHLVEKDCITKDTPFYLTHLCPHWTPPYDIYAPMMAEKGFIVAYDGMQVEI